MLLRRQFLQMVLELLRCYRVCLVRFVVNNAWGLLCMSVFQRLFETSVSHDLGDRFLANIPANPRVFILASRTSRPAQRRLFSGSGDVVLWLPMHALAGKRSCHGHAQPRAWPTIIVVKNVNHVSRAQKVRMRAETNTARKKERRQPDGVHLIRAQEKYERTTYPWPSVLSSRLGFGLSHKYRQQRNKAKKPSPTLQIMFELPCQNVPEPGAVQIMCLHAFYAAMWCTHGSQNPEMACPRAQI
jgi:hypothetical protein